MTLPRNRGFTLIELLIVVTIIAILAAIALPSYNRYGFRARRAESRELLMRLATAEERFFSNFNRYAGTMAELGFTVAQPPCGVIGASQNCHYIVTIGGLGAGNATYTLTATPQGAQAADACLNLMINNMGQKTASGTSNNGNCW